MDKKSKFLIITSTHGNEGFATQVIEEIAKELTPEEYGYDWIIANPNALERNVRFIDTDLNRCAPGDKKSTKYEEVRAAEIMELSKKYNFVIDIHGTNSDIGFVNIIPYPTLSNLILAAMIPIKRNVIWYAKTSLEKGPLVQYIHCPGIEIECGPKSDDNVKEELKMLLKNFIRRVQDINFNILSSNTSEQEYYTVFDKEENSNKERVDFVEAKDHLGDTYYPFLTNNQYQNISHYKMRKVNFADLFLA